MKIADVDDFKAVYKVLEICRTEGSAASTPVLKSGSSGICILLADKKMDMGSNRVKAKLPKRRNLHVHKFYLSCAGANWL